MSRMRMILLSVSATLLLPLAVGACGGGGSIGVDTVATVGHASISRATLNHWMTTQIGSDYVQITGDPAPPGLVSEPADYPRCVSAATKLVAAGNVTPKPSTAQLTIKCHRLYEAVKAQALSYLLSVLWRVEEAAERGEKVSNAEVGVQLRKLEKEQFQTPAKFRAHLAEYRRTLSDELYEIKRNILSTKFVERLQSQAHKLGGGEATFVRLVQQTDAKLKAKTNCATGYLTWQCRQYHMRERASLPSAAVLLEELRRGKA